MQTERITAPLLRALDVLARFIVYDFSVVDIRALQSLEVEQVLSAELLRTVEIPYEVYEEIGTQIFREVYIRRRSVAPDLWPLYEDLVSSVNWQGA
jgi:hypothetical protein